jgi:hypothetical protein
LAAGYFAFSRYTLIVNCIVLEKGYEPLYCILGFLSRRDYNASVEAHLIQCCIGMPPIHPVSYAVSPSNASSKIQASHLPVKVPQGIVKIEPEELRIFTDDSG